MSTAEEGNEEGEERGLLDQSKPPTEHQQQAQQQQQQQQQQPTRQQQRQRAAQTDMPEQRRPAAVSPLKVGASCVPALAWRQLSAAARRAAVRITRH